MFARFLEALYFWVWRCKHCYWRDLVCPALLNGHRAIRSNTNTIVSPSDDLRLSFADKFLFVWAKEETLVYPRHAELIVNYSVSPFSQRRTNTNAATALGVKRTHWQASARALGSVIHRLLSESVKTFATLFSGMRCQSASSRTLSQRFITVVRVALHF